VAVVASEPASRSRTPVPQGSYGERGPGVRASASRRDTRSRVEVPLGESDDKPTAPGRHVAPPAVISRRRDRGGREDAPALVESGAFASDPVHRHADGFEDSDAVRGWVGEPGVIDRICMRDHVEAALVELLRVGDEHDIACAADHRALDL
jgi:hypothetical protein